MLRDPDVVASGEIWLKVCIGHDARSLESRVLVKSMPARRLCNEAFHGGGIAWQCANPSMSKEHSGQIQRLSDKPLFTTGEAAALCQVSQQTIIRCFDKGKLQGFRVPGSRFRRIPRESLIEFMREHEIDTHSLVHCNGRVLLVTATEKLQQLTLDVMLSMGCEPEDLETADSALQAGVMLSEGRHGVLVLDPALVGGDSASVCSFLKQHETLHNVRVIVLMQDAPSREVVKVLKAGADRVLQQPVESKALKRDLSELMSD